jgi:hypothetical protein
LGRKELGKERTMGRSPNKMPLDLVLRQLEQQQEEYPHGGGLKGLRYIINDMKHLPDGKALGTYAELIQNLLPAVGRLASASRRLYRDRESLKPVLENVYRIFEEWDAWLAASDGGAATEEDLQEHLERVSHAMAALREAADGYDAGVLARLAEERDWREKRKKELEKENAPRGRGATAV